MWLMGSDDRFSAQGKWYADKKPRTQTKCRKIDLNKNSTSQCLRGDLPTTKVSTHCGEDWVQWCNGLVYTVSQWSDIQRLHKDKLQTYCNLSPSINKRGWLPKPYSFTARRPDHPSYSKMNLQWRRLCSDSNQICILSSILRTDSQSFYLQVIIWRVRISLTCMCWSRNSIDRAVRDVR